MRHLTFRAPLAEYELQAAELLARWLAGDDDALHTMRHHHPRFLDEKATRLPRDLSESELRAISLELEDAQLVLARWYSFRDWLSLTEWVSSVTRDGSLGGPIRIGRGGRDRGPRFRTRAPTGR